MKGRSLLWFVAYAAVVMVAGAKLAGCGSGSGPGQPKKTSAKALDNALIARLIPLAPRTDEGGVP